MKHLIKLTILLMLFISTSYSQVTTTTNQVVVNNQNTVNQCNTLNFSTTQSNSLVFYFTLGKSSNQAVGNGTVKIYLKNSSSSFPIEKASMDVIASFWTSTQYQSTISCNVGENEVQVSGSSIYIEYNNGSMYPSCQNPIIKTPIPTFTLSPTSLNLSCGDTSAKSFTVTPANIPSGATVTYQWNYNGWSGATTSSSVNLTPTSGTNLPGSVSVTPFINGVANATKTCTVSRSPFNPSFTLTGITQACPGATSSYSINAGTNTVVWSLSTAGIATLNTTTGQNVNLTGIANGSVTLRATVTNACGQSKLFSKQILIGRPIVTNGTVTGGGDNAPINTTRQLTATTVTGATSYVWTVINLSSNCVSANGTPISGVILPKFSNGLSTITTFAPITVVNWGNCPASVVVNCSASNSCGNTGISYKLMNVIGNGGGGDPCPGRMSISPNPVKEDIITVNIADGGDPCGPNPTVNKLAVNNQVKIYDLQGNLLYSNEFKSNTFNIKDLHLKKGHYALNVISSEGYVNKKIIVVE